MTNLYSIPQNCSTLKLQCVATRLTAFHILCYLGRRATRDLTSGHYLPDSPSCFSICIPERATLALEAAGRNPGFALVIAQLNFPPDKALPFLIPYLIVFMALSTVYIIWRRKTAGKAEIEKS
jgi:hypothetical protein